MIASNAGMIIVALCAQFTLSAWTQPNQCIVSREAVPSASLDLRRADNEDTAVKLGDKLLGCARGAAIRRWLHMWHHWLVGTTPIFAILNWFVDWVLLEYAAAQALSDLAVVSSAAVLLGTALLCNNISVTKRVLYSRPRAWYYSLCGLLGWRLLLVWRGPEEGWLWGAKVVMLALLSASVVLIVTLPLEAQKSFRQIGLPVVTVFSATTFLWLKAHVAEMYTKYKPPETNVGGFVSLSTFHQCCDFLLFQARAQASMYKCLCRLGI